MPQDADTFYFYDLETSGINPAEARIMQFAGQRTSLNLEPIGEPDNILIKLTNDVLPDPQAILITGITPQKTIQDGVSEKEFADYFINHVATVNTIILGYNTLRFDNEFMRYLLYRNLFDPYEWSYANGKSTWDLLDAVRMTRALRPQGIEWPVDSTGKAINKLEALTKVNGIEHAHAHDALNDVEASIAVARLIKTHQPKLFDYLLRMRSKQEVQRAVGSGAPFVYTSGRYGSQYYHTTVAIVLADHPTYPNARSLVYDLRVDPTEFMTMTTAELQERAQYTKDPNAPQRLPVKAITYNKGPAIAPLSVLTKDAAERIAIDQATIQAHVAVLSSDPTFATRVSEAFATMQQQKQQTFIVDPSDVDARLYDGFYNDADKRQLFRTRSMTAAELADYHPQFYDDRLDQLLFLYKARQFSASLSADEHQKWEQFRRSRLLTGNQESRLNKYVAQVQSLAATAKTEQDINVLQDLMLWAESIAPLPDDY